MNQEFNKESIEVLARKWLNGTISEEEKAKYDLWYNSFKEDSNLENLDHVNFEAHYENIAEKIKKSKPRSLKTLKLILIPVAACLLIGFFVFKHYKHLDKTNSEELSSQVVKPGSNKAILKLSNGKEISLEDVSSGELAHESGINIVKSSNGEVVYKISSSKVEDKEINAINTITVPLGGTWKIQLPDGTKVWLNSLSSLTFPTNFNNKKERVVELVGEAYFEVTKNEDQHFVVNSSSQRIEVLGTHFNVNAYPNSDGVFTTLIEGSINVSNAVSSKTIKPGEQSLVTDTDDDIKISTVETEYATAWKDGYFMFNYEKLESIMQKLERWYGIKVNYDAPNLKNLKLFGNINKYENINRVIDMLNKAKLFKINIDGNKITVKENNLNQN